MHFMVYAIAREKGKKSVVTLWSAHQLFNSESLIL